MEKIEDLLNSLDRKRLPEHISIVMDGNGRWAKEKGLHRIAGHREGVKTVRNTVRFIGNNLPEVKVLTLYVFSTENWSRPKIETMALMSLIEKYLIAEIPELNSNNVQLHWIGRTQGLPKGVLRSIDKTTKALSKNNGLILNLAINYGGRTDILDASKKLIEDAKKGRIDIKNIDEKMLQGYLYTDKLPPVDLFIRTGGDIRISNFLLWQIAYAELYFTKTYWPDFSPVHLIKAILDFQGRDRRFGNVK